MDDHTPNSVIAWNVRRLHRERGWTQAELAARLTERDDKPWTFSMVSDAETSGRTDRDRQFTVNEGSVCSIGRNRRPSAHPSHFAPWLP